MTDQDFLAKAKEHNEYEKLLKHQPSKEVLDAAILRIKNGEGVSETYYEYMFTVEKESLSNENPHFSDLLKDLRDVFDKYKDKGITEGGWDSKGGSYPSALNLVEDILNQ